MEFLMDLVLALAQQMVLGLALATALGLVIQSVERLAQVLGVRW
jgi:flagellar biosynthesis protein FliR